MPLIPDLLYQGLPVETVDPNTPPTTTFSPIDGLLYKGQPVFTEVPIAPPSPPPDGIAPGVPAIAALGTYQMKRGLDFGTGKVTSGNNIAIPDLPTLLKYARVDGFMEADGHPVNFLSGNGEWERYVADGSCHVFGPNSLKLLATCPSGTVANGSVLAGMLQSLESWKYGFFECRCKLVPTVPNLAAWPAFWLTSADFLWPPEVDLMEEIINSVDPNVPDSSKNFGQGMADPTGDNPVVWVGQNSDLTQNTRWLDQFNQYRSDPVGSNASSQVDFSAGFHVYAGEWLPDTTWNTFIDNFRTAVRTYPWKHQGGADGGPAIFNANLAFGGTNAGRNGVAAASAFPIAFEIDYIRVWQKA